MTKEQLQKVKSLLTRIGQELDVETACMRMAIGQDEQVQTDKERSMVSIAFDLESAQDHVYHAIEEVKWAISCNAAGRYGIPS